MRNIGLYGFFGVVVVAAAAILIPAPNGNRHEIGLCVVGLRTIGMANQAYYSEYGTFAPDLQALVDLRMVSGTEGCARSGNQGSFRYCHVTGVSPDDPKEWPLAFDDPHMREHAAGKRCAVFVDGTTQVLGPGEFDQMLQGFCAQFRQRHGHAPHILSARTPILPTTQPASRPNSPKLGDP